MYADPTLHVKGCPDPMTDIFEAAQRADKCLLDAKSRNKTIPITLVCSADDLKSLKTLSKTDKAWLKASGFQFGSGEICLIPDEKGGVSHGIAGSGQPETGATSANVPSQAANFVAGTLATRLPEGDYHFDTPLEDDALAALAWCLGAYSFDTYKTDATTRAARLKPSDTVDIDAVKQIAVSAYLGRDLINTPANDLGPDELEHAARALAKAHTAKFTVIEGIDLLKKNFPMIHAVGRASDRAPRLIDIKWGKKSDPAITLVGKGIVFDTGGLNLKPGNSMTLMKKDMGGAATALTAASMIMSARLPVQLRVLLPVAENSVSSNAFRPGDVLPSRNGMTVEIGNTDAEGRLVLADALALADDDNPDALFCFATLTGAARVALGPDIPPLYASTDSLASELLQAGREVHDPVWHMPFWQPYDKMLQSPVADVNHITTTGFAGSVTAALFLKRFVSKTANFAHIDLYGWVPTAKPGFPKGGEPQGARAVFKWVQQAFGK